jgi:hypothetical protein
VLVNVHLDPDFIRLLGDWVLGGTKISIKVPEINTREELIASAKKQLEEIREEFLDGFADAYRVDRSDANAALLEPLRQH